MLKTGAKNGVDLWRRFLERVSWHYEGRRDDVKSWRMLGELEVQSPQ